MSTPSVSYFLRYEGQAESQEAFLSRYRRQHAPILAFPVKPDRFALIAQMIFDTKEDLDKALQSDARAIARDDFSAFPPFHGIVYHQAAISEEVFSR